MPSDKYRFCLLEERDYFPVNGHRGLVVGWFELIILLLMCVFNILKIFLISFLYFETFIL